MRIFTCIALAFAVTLNAFAITNEEAIASFELHPDFKIELVASEPQIFDPVDMRFDAQGRMFVMEMPGYPFPEVSGNIVLLEDRDKDGVYESRKVFATDFEVATSILPYNGGLLVASPPDILFLKDTDGDDVADVREVVLTGFEADNQQHNINGLTIGLDNWIYVANGGNSGRPYWPDTPDDKLRMGFSDIRFKLPNRPGQTRQLEVYGRSSGGFGITHDNFGRWFSTHNTQHISQTVFPGRFLDDIPAPRSGTLAQISDHEENGLARIYPIGAQDTRVNHPEQSGFFSGGCGITFYSGGAFDTKGFDNAVFVCDVVLNLVHVDLLTDNNNTTLTASRETSRLRKAFLASTDRAFRPVNMTVGPDGALYLLDMHRDVIEHPEWIPDEMEEKMDLDAGKAQGRIYRITPKGRDLPLIDSDLTKMSNNQLIASLPSKNGWHRKTAQRLLIERKATDVLFNLRSLTSPGFLIRNVPVSPSGNIHALWTLEGLGELSDGLLNPLVRYGTWRAENALMIAETRINSSPEIREGVLSSDLSGSRVNMLRALVAGSIEEKNSDVYGFLAKVAEQDIADPWTRLAIASAAGRRSDLLIARLLQSESITNITAKGELLASLFRTVGKEREMNIICSTLSAAIDENLDPILQQASIDGLLLGLKDGRVDSEKFRTHENFNKLARAIMNSDNLAMRRSGWDIARTVKLDASKDQQNQLKQSTELVTDTSLPLEDRLAHLALLEFDTPENRAPLLFALLDSKQPSEIQKEAIEQLGDITGQNVATKLVERWDTLGPAVRTQAGNILLYKRQNHEILMDALENGDLSLGELNLHLERRRTLLYSRVPGIKERAEKLFTDAGVVTRKEALARMRPALELKGDPLKGAVTFTNVCAECHTVGENGGDLAPNLTEIFRKSAETLMHDIVDPNAATNAEYIAYNVETNDGDFFSGIVVRDDAFGVTLRNAEGEHTFARYSISELFSSGLSLMPEELDTDMELQEMADLLAYLQQPK
ncbi:MAG: PVC-type heme-binding CxxCH protein [Candidatus Hydrogenedentota bacterium]